MLSGRVAHPLLKNATIKVAGIKRRFTGFFLIKLNNKRYGG